MPEAGCPVHRGICAVRTSVCLLEAGSVGLLVKVLGEPDPGGCGARSAARRGGKEGRARWSPDH